jgi:hypothetical protein
VQQFSERHTIGTSKVAKLNTAGIVSLTCNIYALHTHIKEQWMHIYLKSTVRTFNRPASLQVVEHAQINDTCRIPRQVCRPCQVKSSQVNLIFIVASMAQPLRSPLAWPWCGRPIHSLTRTWPLSFLRICRSHAAIGDPNRMFT